MCLWIICLSWRYLAIHCYLFLGTSKLRDLFSINVHSMTHHFLNLWLNSREVLYNNTTPVLNQHKLEFAMAGEQNKQGWEKACGSTKCAICSLNPQERPSRKSCHSLLENMFLRKPVVPKTAAGTQHVSAYGGTNSWCDPTYRPVTCDCREHHMCLSCHAPTTHTVYVQKLSSLSLNK